MATFSAWRVALEARWIGSISISVRITAVRKLAVGAADNGLLAPELAAGISRVKSVNSTGIRVGNWLSLRQPQALISAPDITTAKGLSDRAILNVLLDCGLQRSRSGGAFVHARALTLPGTVAADLARSLESVRKGPSGRSLGFVWSMSVALLLLPAPVHRVWINGALADEKSLNAAPDCFIAMASTSARALDGIPSVCAAAMKWL